MNNIPIVNIVSLDDYPDLLNVKQVQEVLGFGRSVVYQLIGSGEIKHMKIRGKIRIPRRFLIDYLNTLWYSTINTTDAGKSSVSKEVLQ